jgi:hypothetical protein
MFLRLTTNSWQLLGPPPPPPLPHDLANYEKKTANQKAASEGDKGQEAMALERLMSKLDQLDKLDSILQKLNSLNVNIGYASPSLRVARLQHPFPPLQSDP